MKFRYKAKVFHESISCFMKFHESISCFMKCPERNISQCILALTSLKT